MIIYSIIHSILYFVPLHSQKTFFIFILWIGIRLRSKNITQRWKKDWKEYQGHNSQKWKGRSYWPQKRRGWVDTWIFATSTVPFFRWLSFYRWIAEIYTICDEEDTVSRFSIYFKKSINRFHRTEKISLLISAIPRI